MYKKKLEEDIRCPLEYAISLLSGKWKSRIICELGIIGPLRFSELKQDLITITDGVLGATLNELIGADLVEKTHMDDKGQYVYALTEKGSSLIPLLKGICLWARPYYKESDGIVMEHCVKCMENWKEQ